MENTKNFDKALEDLISSAKAFLLIKSSLTESCGGMQELEALNSAMEKAVVLSRNQLELERPEIIYEKPGAPPLKHINIGGTMNIVEQRWLHIRLNALLPHCRFQTPAYLSNTIEKLLNDFTATFGRLPYYDKALLVIDEHCDIKSRTVYDPDNKGWKAVTNTLKGRLFPDDDQFSLGLALVSTFDEKPSCNIYVMDEEDAGEFFCLRADGYL